ncbi:MAG: leucine-rich repeat protein [Clostridia bacterium]|nr:leucine-rich repeat protein [Clostridia bacterium]
MKRNFKKTMSVLLAFTLIFGSFAFGIADVNISDIAIKAEASETFTEGYYTYTVEANGEAAITDVDTSISGDVIVPEKLGEYPVTSIRSWAFSFCDDITSITIPDSARKIDCFAFEYCDNLTSIIADEANEVYSSDEDGVLFNKDKTALVLYPKGNTRKSYSIPESVTIIYEYAFKNCNNLTNVTIPNGVTNIGNGAFSECYGLVSIAISNAVTNIGDTAFYKCNSLRSITVDEANEYYSSDEHGVLFNKNKTLLIQYPAGNERTDYAVPDSVTTIGALAFNSSAKLTGITISDSVTSIGQGAFENTGFYMDSNNWEDDVLYIGKYLIKAKQTLSGSYIVKEGTLVISNMAFDNCDFLTSITIPAGLTHIGDFAFCYCDNLTSVTFPDSLLSIEEYAFFLCISLESVTIPENVTRIGSHAFGDCYSLSVINFKAKEVKEYAHGSVFPGAGLETDGTHCIIHDTVEVVPEGFINNIRNGRKDHNITKLTVGKNVKKINYSAFQNCKRIKEIEYNAISADIGNYASGFLDVGSETEGTYVLIGESVERIQAALFSQANITEIEIGKNIKSIGSNAFIFTPFYSNSDNWENGVLYIDSYLISAEKATGDLTIKEGTSLIADEAFARCELNSVSIPSSVEYISAGSFAANKVNCFSVSQDNMYYCSDESGVIFSKDSTELISYPCNNATAGYIIPDNVTSVGDYAFFEAIHLVEISIPNTVVEIGKQTFATTGLTNVEIPESVRNIGEYAFAMCKDLSKITLNEGLTCINEETFAGCYNLLNIVIPEGVTSIKDYAFASCFGVEYIHIPSSVISIGKENVISNSEKAKIIEEAKMMLENASEEELKAYAMSGLTKENVARWKPTTIICSDTDNCYAKTYAEVFGVEFKLCDNNHASESPEEPTTPTTKPAEPTTTKPAEPTTTKPAEPTTTKPAEPTTTKPSTTVEAELIKKPSTSKIDYGDTLILHADASIPSDAKIEWSMEGDGVYINPSPDGKTCAVTSNSTGDATIIMKYVDANGVEHISEREIKSNAGFWQKLVSFFKNLFRVKRTIEQTVKF